MESIAEYRSQIERRKGRKEQLEQEQQDTAVAWKAASILSRKLREAQIIIQAVALQTQQELQFHISAITTSALEAVFPEPYEFQIEFVERNNKTEADVTFLKDGNPVDPMAGSGGGAIDVAAFSLRCSVWKLKPSRATIILDEPFRFLSRDLQPKAAEMLKEISQKLGLQIIMVTHNEDLLEAADRIFRVEQRRGVAKVILKGAGEAEPKTKIRTRKTKSGGSHA